jgi:hypothetical protein
MGMILDPAGGVALISKFPYLVASTSAGFEAEEAKTGRSLKNESPLLSWLSWTLNGALDQALRKGLILTPQGAV